MGERAGKQADGTADLSFGASRAAVPQKPHEHGTNHLPARPWASPLQSTHSRQPFPQHKRAAPTYAHGVLMKIKLNMAILEHPSKHFSQLNVCESQHRAC